MKRLVGLSLSVLVNALLVGAIMWSSIPTPDGKVIITDLNGFPTQLTSPARGN